MRSRPSSAARIRGVGQQAANQPAANPTGSSVAIAKSHREKVPICGTQADARRICRQKVSSPPGCRPSTYRYVVILLVDVAPIGRPILITCNDARFCVTTFVFFQAVVHRSLLCLVHSLYSHPEESQLFMPFAFFGSPARRLALQVKLTWRQLCQS